MRGDIRKDLEDNRVRLLLVEDDLEDRDLLIDDLKPTAGRYEIVCAGLLQEAMEMVAASCPYDLIMLDLGLPDSQGLDTFLKLQGKAPEIPFVVITGRDDDETAVKALKAGAQDYLVKGRMSAEVLRRSIRYSIERQQLLLRLERERFQSESEHERNALQQLVSPPTTSVTACLYGRAPLKEAMPEIFHRIVEQYAGLLDKVLHRMVLKTQSSPGGELRKMAEELGGMCAGPRDILDIHLQGLKLRSEGQPPSKVKALTEEGRFLMIELLGYLASFYRDYYWSCAKSFTKPGNGTVTGEKTP
jgi:CheY-like chemotaxis protein